MFSSLGKRVVALAVAASMLVGCAEIDRRGGLADQLEDFVLFRADTKSHRLFRSYLLIGVLLAAARREPRNEIDQGAIEGNLTPALAIANEAFYCLYPGEAAVASSELSNLPPEISASWLATNPSIHKYYDAPRWCQFFDERMARLDYAIYRLALTTLFSTEGRKYLADIRDQMIGKIPILSDAGRAAMYANKVVGQASSIVDDLLNLTFKSLGPASALLPLYRDSLELNLIVVINTLQLRCAANPGPERDLLRSTESTPASSNVGYDSNSDCDALGYALKIFNRGNGDLRLWREFIRNFNGHTQTVEAYRPHFLLVTQLMVRSCRVVLANTTDRCAVVLKQALEQSAFNIDNVSGKGTAGRAITATLFGPYPQTAFRPQSRIVRSIPAVVDPRSTGSIDQSKPSGAR